MGSFTMDLSSAFSTLSRVAFKVLARRSSVGRSFSACASASQRSPKAVSKDEAVVLEARRGLVIAKQTEGALRAAEARAVAKAGAAYSEARASASH